MKNNVIKILSICLLVSSANATSLREAVVQTFDTNPDILSEKLNVDAYQKYIDEEKGDYYPTLDFQTYLEDSTTKNDRDDTGKSKASKDGWNAQLSFEQVLYDGGLTPSEVEAFRHKYFSNKFRSKQRVEGIVRNTIDSYLDLVKSQEKMDISNSNLRIHEDYLEIAQEKEEISGEVLESYQVNSKKHFVIDKYLEQKIEKVSALNIFKETTNIDNLGNICRPIIDETLIPNTIEKAIEDSLRKNYKILEAIENIKEQRENIVQANSANLPTLSFQWQGTWDDDLALPENGRQDISRTRLILNWNFYEGGKTKIQKDREKLFLQEKQKILDTVVNEVKREIKTSYQSYFDIKSKIENYKKYVSDNKKIKEVYIQQLVDGTRSFIDILNAESEYFSSALDSLEFEYELYTHYYDILNHRGMLTNSILMSENQICQAFVPTKHVNRFEKNEKDNLPDADLLNELGMDSTEADKENAEDTEIDNLINGTEEETTNETKTISEFPKGRYTINLGEYPNSENMEQLISNLKLDQEKVFMYSTNKNTNLLYGNLNSLKEVKLLINQLDMNLIDSGKFKIDVLDKHEKVYEKFKSIN